MKRLIPHLLLIIGLAFFCNSSLAQIVKPQIILHPSDWRFERIDFPLDFAPELSYEGFEELRFAPGMFNQTSDTYFTYVFVLSINNKVFTDTELNTFLTKYFKGLAQTVAEQKKMEIDLSRISVAIEQNMREQCFYAKVSFLDVFNNAEEVLLNMEIEINLIKKRTYVIALVSPKPKNMHIWDKLRKIKEQLNIKK